MSTKRVLIQVRYIQNNKWNTCMHACKSNVHTYKSTSELHCMYAKWCSYCTYSTKVQMRYMHVCKSEYFESQYFDSSLPMLFKNLFHEWNFKMRFWLCVSRQWKHPISESHKSQYFHIKFSQSFSIWTSYLSLC